MKTNHRRGFVANAHRHQGMYHTEVVTRLSDRSFSASTANDSSNGNRGMAKQKRGAKKFLRSRLRHHENAVTRKLVKEEAS
jgi:hypothetical protein